jgi:hypothetical protein
MDARAVGNLHIQPPTPGQGETQMDMADPPREPGTENAFPHAVCV